MAHYFESDKGTDIICMHVLTSMCCIPCILEDSFIWLNCTLIGFPSQKLAIETASCKYKKTVSDFFHEPWRCFCVIVSEVQNLIFCFTYLRFAWIFSLTLELIFSTFSVLLI